MNTQKHFVVLKFMYKTFTDFGAKWMFRKF